MCIRTACIRKCVSSCYGWLSPYARSTDLPGCLTTGETIEEALKNAEDAKRTWLEAAIEDGTTIREPQEPESYSGQFN